MSMFSSHAALLTKTGAVYTWGNAASGRLGHSSGASPLSRTDTFASDEQAEMKNDDTRVLPERASVLPNPTLVCGLLESVCAGAMEDLVLFSATVITCTNSAGAAASMERRAT